MPHNKNTDKRPWLIGGALVFVGFLIARLAGRFISPREEKSIDDNAPQTLRLRMDERRYPPFYDNEVQGIRVEGEFDEGGSKQLVVIGIDQKELDEALQDEHSKFAVARCDSAGLWHPAAAERALWYGKATDQQGDMYAMAAYVGPSILHVLPGRVLGGHFTACKSTRVIALTNTDGLLYDYPNVPVLQMSGKGTSEDR
jgi:hypothetical protein